MNLTIRKLDELLDKKIDHIAFYRDLQSNMPYESKYLTDVNELEKNCKELYKLALQMLTESCKIEVAVVGNFSCGKSSFINSLVGEDICPVAVNPTTSSITKFMYADFKQIYVLELDKIIDEKEYFELCQHKLSSMGQTKQFTFEYHYPFSDIRNIILYDTPGFKNPKNKNDESITLEYIKHADVALFLLDINNGTVDRDILNIIERFQQTNPEQEWYFVLNKSDQKPPSVRMKILKEAEKNYKNIFKNFFIYSSIKTDEEEFEKAREAMLSFFREKGIENHIIFRKNFEKKLKQYNDKNPIVLQNIQKEIIDKMELTSSNSVELEEISRTFDNFFDKLQETHEKLKDNFIENFKEAIRQSTDVKVEYHFFSDDEYFSYFYRDKFINYCKSYLLPYYESLYQIVEQLHKIMVDEYSLNNFFYDNKYVLKRDFLDKIYYDNIIYYANHMEENKSYCRNKEDFISLWRLDIVQSSYYNHLFEYHKNLKLEVLNLLAGFEIANKENLKNDLEKIYIKIDNFLGNHNGYSTLQQNYTTIETQKEKQTINNYSNLSLAQLQSLAEKGDPEAQYQLAWEYLEGKRIQKNYFSAFHWFYKAAQSGHVKAQYNLARLYAEGLGVSQNLTEAKKWFELAAKNGSEAAKNELKKLNQ